MSHASAITTLSFSRRASRSPRHHIHVIYVGTCASQAERRHAFFLLPPLLHGAIAAFVQIIEMAGPRRSPALYHRRVRAILSWRTYHATRANCAPRWPNARPKAAPVQASCRRSSTTPPSIFDDEAASSAYARRSAEMIEPTQPAAFAQSAYISFLRYARHQAGRRHTSITAGISMLTRRSIRVQRSYYARACRYRRLRSTPRHAISGAFHAAFDYYYIGHDARTTRARR